MRFPHCVAFYKSLRCFIYVYGNIHYSFENACVNGMWQLGLKRDFREILCLILIHRKGERKPTDPEERLSEEEVHILEAFLEEAHASGAGRMSSLSSIRLQSRLQSSLSNLPVIVGGGSQAGVPHSKRGLMHSPVRASLRSLSIGRS